MKKGWVHCKDRPHHNNTGKRSIARGNTTSDVEKMAKKLGIPCGHNSKRTLGEKLKASRPQKTSARKPPSHGKH